MPRLWELASLFVLYLKFWIHPRPFAQQCPPGWARCCFVPSQRYCCCPLCADVWVRIDSIKLLPTFSFAPIQSLLSPPSNMQFPKLMLGPQDPWIKESAMNTHCCASTDFCTVQLLAAAARPSYTGNFIFQLQKAGIAKLQSLLIQQRCKGE